MTKRAHTIVSALGLAAWGLVAGCGDAASQGPDFSACAGTPAVVYAPGLSQVSTSGAFTATVLAASTEASPGAPPVDAPAIGLNRWTIAISDAAAAAVTNMTVSADKPRMPIHGHSSLKFPQVAPEDGGVYVVSEIDFFMAGYWEMGLELSPADGPADRIAFPICIPE
jgi:hypothetical protein